MLSNAEAMRYWSTPPHLSEEETRLWLRDMIEESPAARDDFVVELEGRAIGKCGCWRLPEIGFILHPDHWRRGLAREAIEAVTRHVFERFDYPAITADVDPRNAACLALLRGLGFRETGRVRRTWRHGDSWCDSIYLALNRGDAGA